MLNSPNRNKPEIFKPLIDEALAELARLNGHSHEEVSELLKNFPAEGFSDIGYLRKAAFNLTKWCYQGKVEELINTYGDWSIYLFRPAAFLDLPVLAKNDDEDDPGKYGYNVVHLKDYPEEARQALAYNKYLGGGNGDVLGVWKKDGSNVIYLAFTDAFAVLAKDPVEWIQKVVAFVREKLEND